MVSRWYFDDRYCKYYSSQPCREIFNFVFNAGWSCNFKRFNCQNSAFFTEAEVREDLDRDLNVIEGDLHKVEKDIEGEVRVDDKIVEEKLEKLEAKVEKLTEKK